MPLKIIKQHDFIWKAVYDELADYETSDINYSLYLQRGMRLIPTIAVAREFPFLATLVEGLIRN